MKPTVPIGEANRRLNILRNGVNQYENQSPRMRNRRKGIYLYPILNDAKVSFFEMHASRWVSEITCQRSTNVDALWQIRNGYKTKSTRTNHCGRNTHLNQGTQADSNGMATLVNWSIKQNNRKNSIHWMKLKKILKKNEGELYLAEECPQWHIGYFQVKRERGLNLIWQILYRINWRGSIYSYYKYNYFWAK